MLERKGDLRHTASLYIVWECGGDWSATSMGDAAHSAALGGLLAWNLEILRGR